jgi:putative two-component system response regulator
MKSELLLINNQTAKILIIDDSPEAIEVLGKALPKHYKRQVALSGEKAIKLLNASEELPDLILLDVMMPGMDGYEVCRHLKKDERLKEIPVIYLSSLTDTRDKVKAFEQGGVDYIEKPFQIEEVRARVDIHLKLRFFQKELETYNNNLKEMVEEKVKEISESQIATIFAMAKLAESRDGDTGDHLRRIQIFCRLIAEKLSRHSQYKDRIHADFIEMLQKASPLHDIGKVGIRDVILLKPGRLTPEEYEEMKKHTSIGANTLEEVYQKYPGNYFIKIGIEIAQSHHEKWDGSGYPKGLRGDEIPLSAQIMALVDVYDALRSKRVYKEAYSNAKTLGIMMQGRGKHFNSSLVDTFLEFEQEFDKTFIELKDGEMLHV